VKLTRFTSDQTHSRGFQSSPGGNNTSPSKVIHEESNFDHAGCKENLKKFLKDNKACETSETYEQYYQETMEDWGTAKDNSAVFEIFLQVYHDCHKSAALCRAKTVPWIYRNVCKSATKRDFTEPWLEFTAKCARDGLFSDIPHLSTSLATMVAICISDLGFEFADFTLKWDEDPDMAEEQKFGYKDVLKDLAGVFGSAGNAELQEAAKKAVVDLKTPYE
jgi:hypothetical protein